MGSQYFVNCCIRDGYGSGNLMKVKNMPFDRFIDQLHEFQQKKCYKTKKCAHWLLHNFPDLKLETKCKDCGITVLEVRKERGLYGRK